MNPFVTRVTSGRHLAARTAVLYGATSFHCVVYRRQLIDAPPEPPSLTPIDRDNMAWGGIGQLSTQDDHAFDYVLIGRARIKFASRMGGAMLENDSDQIGDSDTYTACIEPYDDTAPKPDWPKQAFSWKIESGDLIMVVPVYSPMALYYEVAGVMATTVVPDFGKRYLLNPRQELSFEALPT